MSAPLTLFLTSYIMKYLKLAGVKKGDCCVYMMIWPQA